jgi:hypothetical protein
MTYAMVAALAHELHCGYRRAIRQVRQMRGVVRLKPTATTLAAECPSYPPGLCARAKLTAL